MNLVPASPPFPRGLDMHDPAGASNPAQWSKV